MTHPVVLFINQLWSQTPARDYLTISQWLVALQKEELWQQGLTAQSLWMDEPTHSKNQRVFETLQARLEELQEICFDNEPQGRSTKPSAETTRARYFSERLLIIESYRIRLLLHSSELITPLNDSFSFEDQKTLVCHFRGLLRTEQANIADMESYIASVQQHSKAILDIIAPRGVKKNPPVNVILDTIAPRTTEQSSPTQTPNGDARQSIEPECGYSDAEDEFTEPEDESPTPALQCERDAAVLFEPIVLLCQQIQVSAAMGNECFTLYQQQSKEDISKPTSDVAIASSQADPQKVKARLTKIWMPANSGTTESDEQRDPYSILSPRVLRANRQICSPRGATRKARAKSVIAELSPRSIACLG